MRTKDWGVRRLPKGEDEGGFEGFEGENEGGFEGLEERRVSRVSLL